MDHPFDGLAKALAHELPRREALRQLGGGLATVLLASLGVGKAWGQGRGCESYCRARVRSPKAFAKCVASCQDCVQGEGKLCGVSAGGVVTCCGFGLFCIDGACRPATIPVGCERFGEICGAGEKCCAADQAVTCIPKDSSCCNAFAAGAEFTLTVQWCPPGTFCCIQGSPGLSIADCCLKGETCCVGGVGGPRCCGPGESCANGLCLRRRIL